MKQILFEVGPFSRGFHLITKEVEESIGELPDVGMLHLFIRHTSAGLCINENCDPDVLTDFETYFNHIVPEQGLPLRHTMEGPDDMPSHIKSVLSGCSVMIPVRDGKLLLGTWQGIYLCEFRNRGGKRKLVATVM